MEVPLFVSIEVQLFRVVAFILCVLFEVVCVSYGVHRVTRQINVGSWERRDLCVITAIKQQKGRSIEIFVAPVRNRTPASPVSNALVFLEYRELTVLQTHAYSSCVHWRT